jgi:hypothetical protein
MLIRSFFSEIKFKGKKKKKSFTKITTSNLSLNIIIKKIDISIFILSTFFFVLN